MDARVALGRQYHASLAMLKQQIELCPDDLWTAGNHARSFWRIVYHTLFYTHLYLQPGDSGFQQWEKHREDSRNLWADDDPSVSDPYSREELLEYWTFCDSIVEDALAVMDLDSEESGFYWYPIPKLEHQFVNLRHIQGHVGQLSELLMARGIDTDWVGSRRS